VIKITPDQEAALAASQGDAPLTAACPFPEGAASSKRQLATLAAHDSGALGEALEQWKVAQPARTLDELYERAGDLQTQLASACTALAQALGATFANPGVKERATAEEKLSRKRYEGVFALTDVIRGGFTVGSPDQADAIVDALAQSFEVIDEGWRTYGTGYTDRKVIVRMLDGTLAEIQIWWPEMKAAKFGQGQRLYTERRSLHEDDPRLDEVRAAEEALYSAATPRNWSDWFASA
jgi:hypothetical protein